MTAVPAVRVQRTRLALAAAGFSLFLVAAWRSAGVHHPDEYFQTVEFASEKLGKTPAELLPWEHARRLRPYVQPALYAGAARILASLGITAPAEAMLAFRLASALANFAALLLLWAALARRVPDPRGRTWLLAACLLSFHLPYLSVRTSSESVSGALLAAGIAAWLLLESRPVRAGLVAGVVLGLAFDVRYQVGLCAAGFGAWLLFVRRAVRPFLALAGGIAAAVGLGLAVDRWGYGQWTFTPWNYLRANVIEGVSKQFGTSPFYQYLVDLAVTWPPLPALAGLAVIAYWVRAGRDPLTWTTAPLFVGHSLLAHKELRFLFPLAPLAAAMAALLFLDPALRSGWQERWGRRLRPALAILVAANLTVQAAVWDASHHPPSGRFFVIGADAEPFWDFDAHLQTPFLRPPRWTPEPIESWEALEERIGAGRGPVWAVSLLANGPPPAVRARLGIRRAASAVPEWATPYLGSDHLRARLRALWRIAPEDRAASAAPAAP